MSNYKTKSYKMRWTCIYLSRSSTSTQSRTDLYKPAEWKWLSGGLLALMGLNKQKLRNLKTTTYYTRKFITKIYYNKVKNRNNTSLIKIQKKYLRAKFIRIRIKLFCSLLIFQPFI